VTLTLRQHDGRFPVLERADSPTVVNLLAGMWNGIAWTSLFVDTLPRATPQRGATPSVDADQLVAACRSHTGILTS
jgi:hypothetical protein